MIVSEGGRWACVDVMSTSLGHWPLPLLGRPHFMIGMASLAGVEGGLMAGWPPKLAVPCATWKIRGVNRAPVFTSFVLTE